MFFVIIELLYVNSSYGETVKLLFCKNGDLPGDLSTD